MNQVETPSGARRRFERPKLKTTGPDRRTRGFYRIADGEGGTLDALPLDSAEDATVAAVRLGYKVAATQIERSGRLAERLRDAGRRQVGDDPERQALDGAEKLLFETMMAGLHWLEAAAEPDSPFKRLMIAQYRLLGSFLGLKDTPDTTAKKAPKDEDADAAPPRRRPERQAAPPARIFLPQETPRAVRLTSWEVRRDLDEQKLAIRFYSVADRSASPMQGELVLSGAPPQLHLQTRQDSAPGLWRAAVCLATGEQVGIIEIEL